MKISEKTKENGSSNERSNLISAPPTDSGRLSRSGTITLLSNNVHPDESPDPHQTFHTNLRSV